VSNTAVRKAKSNCIVVVKLVAERSGVSCERASECVFSRVQCLSRNVVL